MNHSELPVVVGLFFLDLSKASDTIIVNHFILFGKPEYYSIRGLAVKQIKSCFSRFAEYNDCFFSCHIMWGRPQGSIIGPLFISVSQQ